MNFKSFFALIKVNFLLQMRNPAVLIIMTISPLVMMPFLIPTYKAALIAQGYSQATGAEQAVPGMAILFSLLATQTIVEAFYDEHIWGTWVRLRSSIASSGSIILGKTCVVYIVQTLQLLVVILLGSIIYGFNPSGGWSALIAIICVFSAVITALSVAISLWIPSEQTALSLASLMGIVMSGIGGALGSTEAFPHWAQNIAKISPVYWAIQAMHNISLASSGLQDVAQYIWVLLIFFACFICLSIVKCIVGIDDRKTE